MVKAATRLQPAGRLVLVVGPSGVGKDALIAGARKALADDPRFVFPRRIVTRPASVADEDHDSIDPAAFAALRDDGRFGLHWSAHGLDYGVPAIDDDIEAGRVVVANVSRAVIVDAMTRYPRTAVIEISAPLEVRAARLAARGREPMAALTARLLREGAPVPSGPVVARIHNAGTRDDAVAAMVAAIEGVATA